MKEQKDRRIKPLVDKLVAEGKLLPEDIQSFEQAFMDELSRRARNLGRLLARKAADKLLLRRFELLQA